MGEETDNGNQRGTIFFKQSTALCWCNVRCTPKRLVNDERMRVIYQLFGADWKRHGTSLAEERPWASALT